MKVIFCLPGKEYSGNFIKSWTSLFAFCLKNNIEPMVSQHYSPLVYYARNLCLGGDVSEGIYQKPFGGKIDYDYIMWIDSDVVFEVKDFINLINSDKDIVSGLYYTSDKYHFATVEDWNDEYFLENGHFQFLTKSDLDLKETLFKVSYTGFGWMLIKKGIFEKLNYPWFQPLWVEYKNGDKIIRDFAMEDVSFCKMISDLGVDIWINKEVIVGHEKKTIII